ncbi:hypothetical protein SAY86_026440 [Trapa natans]|uniref:glutamate carboxypeptidase II n=1 Tax=Trapa natans TaxID=22666 RepID=A0AAN7QHQ0_TRANT|nr:hypothetical protein SAY86_026440 [Trapa natans]
MVRLVVSVFLSILAAAAVSTTTATRRRTSYPSFPERPSHYHSLFISAALSDNSTAARHLHALTRVPHVAGTPANAETAAYVLSALASYSVQSRLTTYEVLLTYPISRSLSLTRPPPEYPHEIAFSLRQEIYEVDRSSDVADQVLPTFHGYAKSGVAAGPAVYANYGRVEDFEALKAMGVTVNGSMVVAKYGRIFRGDIVRNAYEAGAAGAVIFTDRKDYGGCAGNESQWFPRDKWMPPSGVQVGSLYNGKGDPTTPGWPSTGGCERLSEAEIEEGGNVPLIPSLPISWADGETIMRTLGGDVAASDWQGCQDGPRYRVGPGPGVLNLSYLGEQKIVAIENVIGVIEGAVEPDRYVLLGNHRDAWTFGAVDPNSGTAALLEIAERLEKLRKRGWKPRRTIIFCSWDAEEYGLIGSTEWVEDNREMLASRAVAYLNVDVAVSGAGFHAASTPQLDRLWIEAAQQVVDPDNSSQSIYDSWVGAGSYPSIDRLGGGGSDFAAFVQHVGIPSTNFYFGGAYPVYHTMYDDYFWMEKFGDPMFQRHVAAASIWGLMALRLADEEFLPFDYLDYASELEKTAQELQEKVPGKKVDFDPLFKSIEELRKAAEKVNMEKKIYAPSKHDNYGSKSFPGVSDAIEDAKTSNKTESWKTVQHEVWRVTRVIRQASLVLDGQLT